MTKKRCCQKCQKEIEEGKEIKVKKGSNYYSSRYSSWPRDTIVYYLCPTCYKQYYQEEIRAKREKTQRLIVLSSLGIFLITILILFFFSISNYRHNKRINWLTKKAQKKTKNE